MPWDGIWEIAMYHVLVSGGEGTKHACGYDTH